MCGAGRRRKDGVLRRRLADGSQRETESEHDEPDPEGARAGGASGPEPAPAVAGSDRGAFGDGKRSGIYAGNGGGHELRMGEGNARPYEKICDPVLPRRRLFYGEHEIGRAHV